MYGLINNALKGMIIKEFGEEQWQQVLSRSGVADDSFLSMRSYDDSVTYALVDSASEIVGAPVDSCLEMFGQFWVEEVAGKSYGILMNAAGRDMVAFLGNLNTLHDRITSTFINYLPPEFYLEQKGDRYLIHYISRRQGLTPFVVGLLKGLATRFGNLIIFHSQVSMAVDFGAHTVFEVEITQA